MNIADALDIHARARPDHPALIHGDVVVSHAALRERVRGLAAHIRTLVPDPRGIIGLCLDDGVDHVVAMFAAARAERAMLPMDRRWTAGDKERLIAHFRPDVVIVEADESAVFDVPTVGRADVFAAKADPETAFGSDAEAPLWLSLSSGTTGRPKGPLITHRHFFRRMMTHWINLGVNARDRFVVATPMYFGGGRTFLMSVLCSGGTAILSPPPFAIETLPALVRDHGATSLFLVPTQLRRLLELDADAVAPLRGLHLLLSSGAPLGADERVAIRDRLCPNFFEYYASTEGGGVTLLTPADIARKPRSVGRPVFAVEVEAVDDADRPLPPGEVGRLRYRGPGVAIGYHGDPEASLEAFRDGWFYPGDLGSVDAEGYLTLAGRSKDMIIRAGVNIYPADVEAVLNAHPAVRDSAVVGIASPVLGEEVAAAVVLAADIGEPELIDWCRPRLAAYKVPARIVVVAELAKTSAGKVDKAAVRRVVGDPPR